MREEAPEAAVDDEPKKLDGKRFVADGKRDESTILQKASPPRWMAVDPKLDALDPHSDFKLYSWMGANTRVLGKAH